VRIAADIDYVVSCAHIGLHGTLKIKADSGNAINGHDGLCLTIFRASATKRLQASVQRNGIADLFCPS
jgi:hypothetical protein